MNDTTVNSGESKARKSTLFETPMTKAVGYYFVTILEPTALVVGIPIEKHIARQRTE